MDPVAERIRSQTMELAARWETRARELPELQHMSQPVLFDHLFELLEGLAAWIEGEHEIANRAFDALLDGHALQRLGHGVSLKTLIAEYAHGGLCEATSDDQATTFRMQLPRLPGHERLAKAVS
jgi:hypothetical protein